MLPVHDSIGAHPGLACGAEQDLVGPPEFASLSPLGGLS
jgi:hypothetical protein